MTANGETPIQLLFTDGRDERFLALCLELDGHLYDRVGGETQRSQYAQYNTTEKIADAVLLLEDGQAVACGGFKPYGEGTAEIKRVFTKPAYRGRGYARAVMEALEKRALSKGYTRLILETGRVLEPAVRLYKRLGYQVIPNYGQYCCLSESVCMEKRLTR